MKYNPVYICARLARRFTPEALVDRFLASRHAFPEDRFYQTTRDFYLRAIRCIGPERFLASAPLTILEAGTGLYNPFSAPLLLSDIDKLILLEPYPGDVDNRLLYRRFKLLLTEAELDQDFPLPRRRTIADLLANSRLPNAVTMAETFWEATGLPADSVDSVLSIAVLEHVRLPEAVLRESFRILRPGGWFISMIDMRDHIFRYPMEMYKYPAWAWRLLTTQSGGSGYLNRNTAADWRRLLIDAGFRVEAIIENKRFADETFVKAWQEIHSAFQYVADQDLRLAVATFVAQKPR